jgi:hypothetical protein
VVSTALPTIGRRRGAMKDISNENCDAISVEKSGHYNFAVTDAVQAIFKCLTSSYFQMSRFNALGLPLT